MKEMTNRKHDEAKNEIEYLVLKNFISVLKKNNMYPMFRCVVGGNTKNVVSSIYKRMPSFSKIIKNQSKENIYSNAGNMETFIKLMKDCFHGGLPKGEKDPAKLQQHIANCTNMLLHVFIERNVRDFKRLESLGESIFNMTCQEIFGGEFEDMLPQPTQNMEQMRRLNQMMIDGSLPRPTPEMMEQIRNMMERARQEDNQFLGNGHPMVDDNDWDFLDDFLGEDGEPEELEEDDIDWEDDWN